MPTYCYTCPECSSQFERTRPIAECRAKTLCECGSVAERDIVREQRGTFHAYEATYPRLSNALACHPDQVGEMTAEATRREVPTEFSQEGQAVIRSRSHQKKYEEAFGYFNKDAGYGDSRQGARTHERWER